MTQKFTRRDFIAYSAGAAVSTVLVSTMGGAGAAAAAEASTSGYKAMVCVYLIGGNDGFNWFVPLTSSGHSTYANTRSNLALASSDPLPLSGTASDGYTYGIHPSCPELQALFNAGHAAVLSNVGTLVQPTTPVQARAGSVALPRQLFSHIDQETLWMTSIADSAAGYGWAGRIADFYGAQGSSAGLPMNINVGPANTWQQGVATNPYVLGTSGAPILDDTDNTTYRNGARAQAAAALLSQAANDGNLLVQQFAAIQQSAASKVTLVNGALSAAGDVSTPFPAYAQDSSLGAQLHMVARMIKAQSQTGSSRQMFFVALNGFDTHDDQLTTQSTLLRVLSQNLNSFWSAMGEIGMQNDVTVFTASDFGRSMGSNGSGSDHAWGSHQLILGGSVQGGKYYGTMPSLVIGGANDMTTNGGLLVPTTSTDQYAATLAGWFGIAASDLPSIFPNLKNFPTQTLGFMG